MCHWAPLLQPMPQGGSDPGHELVHAEGLGDVVVGPKIERPDLAGFVLAA
jgi:hypothetical protein